MINLLRVDNTESFHLWQDGKWVCEACCDQVVIEGVGGGMLIYHCDLHMTLCIRDGEVLSAQTNGIRQ